MILEKTWTQGLTQTEQALVIEIFITGGNFTVDVWKNAGYRSAKSARTALKKEKVRRAIKLFSSMQLEIKADFVKSKAASILVRRAFYNPFNIITADGGLKEDWIEDPKKMGELAHCVDSIETNFDKMGRKQVKIKLANKSDAIAGLDKLFHFDAADDGEDMDGKKSVFLLTDTERRQEIRNFVKKFDQKKIEHKKKKGKGK